MTYFYDIEVHSDTYETCIHFESVSGGVGFLCNVLKPLYVIQKTPFVIKVCQFDSYEAAGRYFMENKHIKDAILFTNDKRSL